MSFGSITRLNSLGKFSYKEPSARVDNLIIGLVFFLFDLRSSAMQFLLAADIDPLLLHLFFSAGVVGLAIARQLVLSFPSLSTYLIERHGQPGQETRCVCVKRFLPLPLRTYLASVFWVFLVHGIPK